MSDRRSPLALARKIAGLSALVMVAAPSWAQVDTQTVRVPEPDPVPQRWELEFKPGPLRLIQIPTPAGDSQGHASGLYLYMTYDVTNYSGQDLQLVPSFTLATTDGQLRASGLDVPRRVTDHVLARLSNPLLMDQVEIIGPMLQGEEHARFGVVIWPIDSIEPGLVTVFAAGFSGESDSISLPNPATGEIERFVFRKTRMLRHLVPGELMPAVQRDRPLARVEERWVMR